MPDRIRERLDALQISPREASRRATGGPDLVRNILNGKQTGTSYDKAQRLAAALQCSVEYLYGQSNDLGEPPEVTPLRAASRRPSPGAPRSLRLPLASNPFLPVRYVVQAGAWLEVDEAAQHRIVSPPVSADPAFPREAQWLEIVRGDSVDLVYPEGTYVHVVDAKYIGYAPRDEDFVVVERRRQQGGLTERSLKQVEKRGRKVSLWPRSRNPKWKAPLDLGDSADDDTVVEIDALVLGGYLPARRT